MKENIEITEKRKSFAVREVTLEEIDAVITLQDECVEALLDSRLYYPLTQEELSESLQLDKVLGAFVEDTLVAVAVIIVNREGSRNLALDTGLDPHHTFTFDVVLVSPRWRGYGLQKLLLQQCLEIATEGPAAENAEITNIVATVSPDNSHSLNNFLSFGFEIVSTSAKYSNLMRHLLIYPSNKKNMTGMGI